MVFFRSVIQFKQLFGGEGMGRKNCISGMMLQAVLLVLIAGVAVAAVDLPEKLKGVPLFPGSKVLQAMDMQGGSMATVQVQAARDDVVAFYKKHLSSDGWKIIFQAEQEDASIVHFQKEKEMIHLSIQSKGQGDSTTYTLVSSQQ